jgi:hypothetical protein
LDLKFEGLYYSHRFTPFSSSPKLEKNKFILEPDEFNYSSSAANNTVLIMKCDVDDDIFYSNSHKFISGHISDFYYILPEKLSFEYEFLTTGRYCPFLETFDDIMLRVFESGIRQHWPLLLPQSSERIDFEQISFDNEEFLLTMEDLKYIFALWGVGIAVSLLGFISEWLVYKNKEKIRKSIIGRVIKKLTWHGRVRERAAVENES